MMRRGSAASRLSALLLAVVALAVLGVAVVGPAHTRYADNARRIDELRAQLAALEAAAGRAAARRAALEKLGRDPDLRDLLLPPASEATATARLQERFGAIIEGAGARLSTTQVLPVKAAEAVRRIGLRLQFTADTKSLRAILHALEFGRPATVLESVFIHARTSNAVGAILPLTVRLDAYAFLPVGG